MSRRRPSANWRNLRRIGLMAGAEDNLYEVDDLLVQPGTYFNPQTEVVVIVDDSASIDQEVFDMEAYEGADWVRVSTRSRSTRTAATASSRSSRRTTTRAPPGRSPKRPSSRATTSSTRTRTGRSPAARTSRP